MHLKHRFRFREVITKRRRIATEIERIGGGLGHKFREYELSILQEREGH